VEFLEEYKRWNWVFEKRVSYDLPYYNLSGNHDIGYRLPDIQEKAAKRFIEHFGPLNMKVEVGGFHFIIISSLTLEDDSENVKSLVDETWNFIGGLNPEETSPKILLTHVPLWRPEGVHCGKHNRGGPISDRIGHSYRNMLPADLSRKILEKIKPLHTFSGDDHDQCEYQHEGGFVEHTIGTFSFLQGQQRPSFGMILLNNDKQNPSITVSLCFMPTYNMIFLWYAVLLAISFYLLCPFTMQETRGLCKKLPGHEVEKANPRKMKLYVRNIGIVVGFVLPLYIFLLWIET